MVMVKNTPTHGDSQVDPLVVPSQLDSPTRPRSPRSFSSKLAATMMIATSASMDRDGSLL